MAQAFPEPVLDIGIVQRFGEENTDRLVLDAVGGDRFTVTFATGGQPQEITTSQVILEVVASPLPEPMLSEKVVLSSHRSFESAEDSANYWQEKGIEVELAQPQQWQVWGKRSVYRSPLLRRLLLQNLQANGATTAFIDSKVVTEKPQAAFIVDGFRYHRDRVTIDAGRNQAELMSKQGKKPNAYMAVTSGSNPMRMGPIPSSMKFPLKPTSEEWCLTKLGLGHLPQLLKLKRFWLGPIPYAICVDLRLMIMSCVPIPSAKCIGESVEPQM